MINKKHDINFLYFLSISTALCAMVYELLLAQSISSVMGNSILRYNTTIGVYLAAMGVGALSYSRIFKNDILNGFVKAEICLSVAGALFPFLIIFIDFLAHYLSSAFNISYHSNAVQWTQLLLNYMMVFMIGFLSGFELPLLTDLAKKFQSSTYKILAFDYFGTLLGAALFPTVILIYFNVFNVGYAVALVNLTLALVAYLKFNLNDKYILGTLVVLMLILSLALIFNNSINSLIIDYLYMWRGNE